jgi:hypothetical protein
MPTTFNYNGFELNEAQVQAIEKFVALIAPSSGGPTTMSGSVVTEFNPAIPLDIYVGRDMGVIDLADKGDITFSVAGGAVHEGLCSVEIIADGTHSVDIDTHWVNPLHFSFNTTSGQHNLLFFEYRNDAAYVYGVLGQVLDVLAPTLLSAVVDIDNPTKVKLTWSEAMAATVAAASAFPVPGRTVSAHTYLDSDNTELTVSPAFVAGDPSTTVGYVVPAGIKQRDLANNNVSAFSSFPITNNVVESVVPTVMGMVVFNSTPDRVDITYSEAMNSTMSAETAWGVSGHTPVSHTRDDATHSHLIVTPPFIYGEAPRTGSYTQPGTNNMQDLAGNLLANFSGRAITNNVAGAAAIDDFNRANGPIGISSGGLVWQEFQGPARIVGNKCFGTPGDASFDVLDAGVSVGTISATIEPWDEIPSLRFRVVDQNNYMNLAFFSDLGFCRLSKMVGGISTDLISGGSFTPNVGTPIAVQVIVAAGGVITVKLNGVTTINFTDNTHSTGTKHGFFIVPTLSNIDNFSVT